jgi:hypothetical protein
MKKINFSPKSTLKSAKMCVLSGRSEKKKKYVDKQQFVTH